MALSDFIKPTKGKLILSLILSVIIIALVFSTPNIYRDIFLSRSLMTQILDVIVNVLILALIFYPISCIFVAIYHRIKK